MGNVFADNAREDKAAKPAGCHDQAQDRSLFFVEPVVYDDRDGGDGGKRKSAPEDHPAGIKNGQRSGQVKKEIPNGRQDRADDHQGADAKTVDKKAENQLDQHGGEGYEGENQGKIAAAEAKLFGDRHNIETQR